MVLITTWLSLATRTCPLTAILLSRLTKCSLRSFSRVKLILLLPSKSCRKRVNRKKLTYQMTAWTSKRLNYIIKQSITRIDQASSESSKAANTLTRSKLTLWRWSRKKTLEINDKQIKSNMLNSMKPSKLTENRRPAHLLTVSIKYANLKTWQRCRVNRWTRRTWSRVLIVIKHLWGCPIWQVVLRKLKLTRQSRMDFQL